MHASSQLTFPIILIQNGHLRDKIKYGFAAGRKRKETRDINLRQRILFFRSGIPALSLVCKYHPLAPRSFHEIAMYLRRRSRTLFARSLARWSSTLMLPHRFHAERRKRLCDRPGMPVLFEQLAHKKVIIFPSTLLPQLVPFSFCMHQPYALAPPQQSGSQASTALGSVRVGLTMFPGKPPGRMHKLNLVVI